MSYDDCTAVRVHIACQCRDAGHWRRSCWLLQWGRTTIAVRWWRIARLLGGHDGCAVGHLCAKLLVAKVSAASRATHAAAVTATPTLMVVGITTAMLSVIAAVALFTMAAGAATTTTATAAGATCFSTRAPLLCCSRLGSVPA